MHPSLFYTLGLTLLSGVGLHTTLPPTPIHKLVQTHSFHHDTIVMMMKFIRSKAYVKRGNTTYAFYAVPVACLNCLLVDYDHDDDDPTSVVVAVAGVWWWLLVLTTTTRKEAVTK